MPVLGVQLRTILLAVKKRLIDQSVFPADRCKISLRMNVPMHDQAESYAIILPLNQTHDQGSLLAQGRFAPIVNGRINVYVRHRSALDQGFYDDIFLTADGGLLDQLAKAEDALDEVMLMDPADGVTPLLVERVKAQFANEPRKDYGSPDWGEGMIEMQVTYRVQRTN